MSFTFKKYFSMVVCMVTDGAVNFIVTEKYNRTSFKAIDAVKITTICLNAASIRIQTD